MKWNFIRRNKRTLKHAVITQDHKFQNHVLSFREVDTIICLEIQRANIPSTLGLMLPRILKIYLLKKRFNYLTFKIFSLPQTCIFLPKGMINSDMDIKLW